MIGKAPERALECTWYRAGYCKLFNMCTMDIGNKCKLEEEQDNGKNETTVKMGESAEK